MTTTVETSGPTAGTPDGDAGGTTGGRAFPVSWRRLALETSLPAAIALAYACVLYRVWELRWEMPIYADGSDASGVGAMVKGLDETGWWLSNPRLNFPFGTQSHDFPAGGESLQILALRVLNWLTPGFGQTMNVYYLAGFGLVAAVAFLVLRHLRLPFVLSAIFAVAYTFLPYHFVHEQSHLTRSTYFTGPLAVLLVLWTLSWRERFLRDPDPPPGTRLLGNLRRDRVAFAAALAFVIGVTETMTSAFAMTVIGGCAIVAAIRWREPRRLAVGGAAIGMIVAAFILVSIPTIAYMVSHGSNEIAGARIVAESEYYSLKISRLLLPGGDHRFTPWGEFGAKAQIGSPIPTEGGQYLGLLGIVGFVGGLIHLFGAGLRRRGRHDTRRVFDRGALLDHSSLIIAISLVAGTVGGFGVVLATFGFEQIRTWGRIEVMLAFAAFIVTGLFALRVGDWLRERVGRAALVSGAGLAVMGVLALFDGIPPAHRDYDALKAGWISDRRFVTEIERRMPDGSAILQLPLQPYPEAGVMNMMRDYDHFHGYLHDSGSLYWSYGGVKGRPGADWQLRVRNQLGPIAALPALIGMGYDGVWVDTAAFPDGGAEFLEQLEDKIDTRPLVSENGRLRFYDLRRYKASLGMTDEQLRALAARQLGIEPPAPADVGKPPPDNEPTTQAEWNALWEAPAGAGP